MEADSDGYLQYYTKITILGVGIHGFLCSGGTGIAANAVELEEATNDEIPRNFERCVWAILPVDLWNTASPTARDAFKYQRAHSRGIDETTYVRYGDTVLLQHAKTGCYMMVCTNLTSDSAPNSFAVDFAAGPRVTAADRCFRIVPKYKIRQEGEYIRLKDQVLFRFANSDWRHLNAIESPKTLDPRSHEVTCGPQHFAWRLQVYDDPTINPSDIRAGQPVLLYHNEIDGFFTATPFHSDAAATVATVLSADDDASTDSDGSDVEISEMLTSFEFGVGLPNKPAPLTVGSPSAPHQHFYSSRTRSASVASSVTRESSEGTPRVGNTLASHKFSVHSAHSDGTGSGSDPRTRSLHSLKGKTASVGDGLRALGKKMSSLAQMFRGPGGGSSPRTRDPPVSPRLAAEPQQTQGPPTLTMPRAPAAPGLSLSALDLMPLQSDLETIASERGRDLSITWLPSGSYLQSQSFQRDSTGSLVHVLTHFMSEFRNTAWHFGGAAQVQLLKKVDHSVHPNAMWILEGARADRGGSVHFGAPYRLRHLASSSYLTVGDNLRSMTQSLAVSAAPSTSSDTLFLLYPLDSDAIALTSTTPVRLKHEATGLYVKRPATLQDPTRTVSSTVSSSEVDAPLSLELSHMVDDDDVFTLDIPTAGDLDDVHFVLKMSEALTACVAEFHGGATLKQLLAAQSVLTSLALFCTDSQDPDPMNCSGEPVVRHQQLLLEMNVQALVIELLKAPFQETAGNPTYSIHDLESPHNSELAKACALAYRLLQLMVRGSPSFAFGLAAYVPFMLSQLGYCRLAADTLSEMFTDNRQLLEHMPSRFVTSFVRVCTHRVRQAGYLKFLCGLCVCDGNGILSNQSNICKHLLEEHPELLLQLRLQNGAIQVRVPEDEDSRLSARDAVAPTPVHTSGTARSKRARGGSGPGPPGPGRWVDLSEFYATAGARLTSYFEQSLELFAKLCVGANMRTREVVRRFVSQEMLVAAIGLGTPHHDIPDRVKSRLWSIVSVVYLMRPSHAPTVLGVRGIVKDCCAGQRPRGNGERTENLDWEFLGAIKSAATDYLRRNTEQELSRPERNLLTHQVIKVWERIVHYAECTEEELREVVEILLQLVDGTTDTMPFSFCRQPTMALMMSTRSFGGAPGPSMDRYEFSEQNQHIMKCKVAACRLFLVALDLMAEEKVHQVVDHIFDRNADPDTLVARMMASVREPVADPVYLCLSERLLPILRDLLNYQHHELVWVALTLIFRLSMTRSETSALLQEVVLLMAPRMVQFYEEACAHAVRLQVFFNNKSNLKGQWCELMMKELSWFRAQAQGRAWAVGTKGLRRNVSLNLSVHHFQRQCEASSVSSESNMQMQDVCRILKLHDTVMNVLKAVSQDKAAASRMQPALYGFLRWFSTENPKNQVALYTAESVPMFVEHLQEEVGAEHLLLAVLEANYELCARNNAQLIHNLVALVADKSSVAPVCAQCLQQLAVVNQIPVHRNQQQILHAMVSTHGEFLQGTQRLADMTDEEREWLCAVATLVCTCCVGNDPEAQVLAQGLLPLPRLLKMLVEVDDLVLVEEQQALLWCLRDVWWAWHRVDPQNLQEATWWNVVDPWWKTWWAVMQQLEARVRGFVADGFESRPGTHLEYLLNAVTPSLTGFFQACQETSLHALLDEECCATARAVAEGLVAAARQNPKLTRAQGEDIAAFAAVMTQVIDTLDLEQVPFEPQSESAGDAACVPDPLLLALHLVQTRSREQFPPDTLDGVEEFDLQLVGIAEDGELDSELLEKLMGQITDGALSAKVKVGLLRCFTMFIDRHRKDFPGMMPLRKAQTQLAAMGATKLVARMVQAPEPEVFSAVVQFATSLFWGGNGVVQDSLLTHLEADASHSFMRTLSEKLAQSLASMRNWKSELAFVTTTVPELGAQVRQDMLLAKTDVIESKGVLRFLQLLCEGHHAPLQNYLREQPGNNPVNIVDDIMRFLKEVISGRMEELIFGTAIQTFHTLTELCQGPCPENQAALVARNVMSDINEVLQSSFPARDPTLVFELRCAATLTLLSLLEGCNEQARPQLMARTINFTAVQAILDSVWDDLKGAVASGGYLPESQQALMGLAFNLFILMYQLRTFCPDDDALRTALKECSGYDYFQSLLGVVEIARGDHLEKVYFPIPQNCDYLTDDLKTEILYHIDRSSASAKVTSFQAQAVEVASKIDYDRRMTEWLQEGLLPLVAAVCPRLARKGGSWIHHRELMQDHLQNVILAVAVVVNVVVTVFHNDLSYEFWEQAIISALSWALVGLTGLNFAVSAYLSRFTIQQEGWVVRRRNAVHFRFYFPVAYTALLALMAVLGLSVSPHWFAGHLLMIVNKSTMLHILIRSVILNGWSLLLTAALTVVIVYLFVVVGYVFFREDFVGAGAGEGVCGSLLQCFMFGLLSGVRAGGGLGDLLPYRRHGLRNLFDFAFYLVIVVIILNIVFGIIIDTFAQLRDQKHAIEEDTRQHCLICGQDANLFDRVVEGGFTQHVRGTHNMWHYLYFIVYLNQKSEDEYTGQESYVSGKILLQDVSFFPLNKSMDVACSAPGQAKPPEGDAAAPPAVPPIQIERIGQEPQEPGRDTGRPVRNDSAYLPVSPRDRQGSGWDLSINRENSGIDLRCSFYGAGDDRLSAETPRPMAPRKLKSKLALTADASADLSDQVFARIDKLEAAIEASVSKRLQAMEQSVARLGEQQRLLMEQVSRALGEPPPPKTSKRQSVHWGAAPVERDAPPGLEVPGLDATVCAPLQPRRPSADAVEVPVIRLSDMVTVQPPSPTRRGAATPLAAPPNPAPDAAAAAEPLSPPVPPLAPAPRSPAPSPAVTVSPPSPNTPPAAPPRLPLAHAAPKTAPATMTFVPVGGTRRAESPASDLVRVPTVPDETPAVSARATPPPARAPTPPGRIPRPPPPVPGYTLSDSASKLRSPSAPLTTASPSRTRYYSLRAGGTPTDPKGSPHAAPGGASPPRPAARFVQRAPTVPVVQRRPRRPTS